MARNVHERRNARQLLLILSPSLILLLAFTIYPAIYSVYLSLTNEALTGIAAARPRFVGLANYNRLLHDASFWNSLLVTFFFVVGSAVIGQFVLGLISAVMLRRPLKLKPLFSAIILLPNAAPEVVAGFMWERDARSHPGGGPRAWLPAQRHRPVAEQSALAAGGDRRQCPRQPL